MKKFKKIAALLLAMVMALAMAVPAMAAESSDFVMPTSKITVTGLNEGTTVTIYKIVYYDSTTQDWVVVEAAQSVVTDIENFTDWEGLKEIKDSLEVTDSQTVAEGKTSVEFTVDVGMYLVLATDPNNKVTYTVMGTNTYNESATYLEAKDAEVVAKTSGYDVDKEAAEGDEFAARGEEVEFDITTIFPTVQWEDKTSATYVITDDPENGLKITDMVFASDSEVTDGVIGDNKDTATWTLSPKDNTRAGKKVKLHVTAIVTSDTGYKNTVKATLDGEPLGDDEVNGYTGSLTLTKTDGADTALAGAKFKLTLNGEEVSLVEVSAGNYKVADPTTDAATDIVTEAEVGDNGVLNITGLGDGTYTITETQAPSGYSINDDIPDVTITSDTTQNVSVERTVVDTKLSSLPSTGGIGTTIFTVAGCMIMIAAGGMLIVSRRRKNA